VKVLVEKGCINVNSMDYVQTTPLTNAARTGDCDSVKFLLDHGADPTYERE
jgi:ankyrin repeat protein